MHTEAVFSGVFEQGVAPSGTEAVLIGAVGHGGSGAAPDGGTAGGVGDHHAFAEELGDELHVGGLAAAGAGAGEFQQGLAELGTLEGAAVDQIVLDGDVGIGEGKVGNLIGLLGFQRLHGQSAFLSGADVGAGTAAEAVFSVHLDAELEALEFLAGGVDGDEAGGSAFEFFRSSEDGTDGGMGAGHGAAVALDALGGIPFGNHDGHAALFAGGGAEGHDTGGIESGDGQLVALLGEDGTNDVGDVGIGVVVDGGGVSGIGPGFGVLDLDESFKSLVHGFDVHVDDLVALLAVGLLDGGLDVGDGFFEGKHVGQREEGGLGDHVDAVAEAHFSGDLDSVNVVELQALASDGALHVAGKFTFHVFHGGPGGVQEEGAAVLDAFEHVIHVDVGVLVAGDEVGAVHEVGRLQRSLAETQVRHGEAAGLLGVVGEVSLSEHIGVVTDDLDGVLVGADGAVGAEAEELALHGAGGHGVDVSADLKGEVGHVVFDADSEVVLGRGHEHIVVDGLTHGRSEFLGAEAVAAGDDLGEHTDLVAVFHKSGADVLIEGFAESTGFLGAIDDGDGLHGGGQNFKHMLGAEGTIQTDLEQTDAFALSVQVVDHFFENVAGRAHGHDHAVGFSVAIVIEGLVVAAGDGSNALHGVDHNGGNFIVEGVAGFAVLEVDVGVLSGAALMGMLRIHGGFAEFGHLVPVHDLADVFVVDEFDLADFVRGTETVEEVAEGHAGVDGGKVSHQSEVHGFLGVVGAEEGKAGLASSHDVLMVTEDGQGVGSERTSGNMEDAGEEFASDLVHVGDHEQQALRSGEGGGQSAGNKGAVHGASGTGFRLHFTDGDLLAHQVQLLLGSPFVDQFAHDGRRSDGVDGGNIAKSISNVCGSGVTVHGFEMFGHKSSS